MSDDQTRIEASFHLSLLSQEVDVHLRLPAGPCRLGELVPVVHGLADLLAADGVRAAEANGRTISCRKGCGACCRVLVPLAAVEARYLYDVVTAMPEEKRARVLRRFQEAWGKLEEAGLLGAMFEVCGTGQERQGELAGEYFRLNIPCPFLEEGACSIYPDRPVVCREVIVVSPAENCATAREGQIEQVKLAGRVSGALARMGDGEARWVPHVVAAAWALRNPEEWPARGAVEWIGELLDRVVGRRG